MPTQQNNNEYIHPFHEWSSEVEVGAFIASLMLMTNAKRILEVGVFHGETSRQLIEATPLDGVFIGIDIEDLRNDEAKAAYNVPRATFLEQDSVQAMTTLAGQKFDVIFVDAMHYWAHILPEFKAVEPLLAPGGVIIYHDSMHIEDVKKLMDYAQRWNYSRIDLQTPGARGLTILQKKK